MNGESTLPERYERLRRRVREACEAAGRPAGAVSILAVSKTFPADQVLELAALGQRVFGESYLQEALAKIDACEAGRQHALVGRPEAAAPGAAPAPLEWHFIGPIQSNKTRPLAERFDWVHSIDRERIARRLSEQRPAGMAALNVCVQVNVSGEASKSGCSAGECPELARQVAALPGLRLRGLMAIPAPSDDPAFQRAQFARLRELFERLRGEGLALDTLSMGMSDDLEAAVAEGATMVRVGSALFGSRPHK
ncbi:MAG: YggS family pyridoxal phosphate-dependent enzyme [Gammaproteobacteria bacterium]